MLFKSNKPKLEKIQVTFKDLYSKSEDSIIMEGRSAKSFLNMTPGEQAYFLSKLETVTFKDIYSYSISIKKI